MSNELAHHIEIFYSNDQSVLLHESHHHINNKLQTIISLIQLQKAWYIEYGQDTITIEDLDEFCSSISSRIKSSATIHDLLAKDSLTSNIVNVTSIIEKVTDFYKNSLAMNIELQFENIFVPHGNAVSLALLLN